MLSSVKVLEKVIPCRKLGNSHACPHWDKHSHYPTALQPWESAPVFGAALVGDVHSHYPIDSAVGIRTSFGAGAEASSVGAVMSGAGAGLSGAGAVISGAGSGFCGAGAGLSGAGVESTGAGSNPGGAGVRCSGVGVWW